ncbi:MAG: glycosyltransferase [Gaiellaceae bacterium]|jgi:glycosyltransferase involved in cell wall biosynthesis
MSATVLPSPDSGKTSRELVVEGVRDPRSLGISRYAIELAEALGQEQVDYRLDDHQTGDRPAHFHLANSSRALLRRAPSPDAPFFVTVHDVVPRTRALLPLYRALVYPRLARHAAGVIVHTAFAADMLVRELASRPAKMEVIPHPTRRPRDTDRVAARRALGWPLDALIAVVPGVIKPVKLVGEALAAVSDAPGWRMALAGRVADRGAAEAARAQDALVLAGPDDADYERAIVASDCVLCLRADSVGETNGPLLDALGAGRAVLATRMGSIPEVAGDAASYCAGTERAIHAGLVALSDPETRAELEAAATRSASGLTWKASAAAHAALFREVLGA